jgi:metal-responsive CopG/Arc/MetJ family transcriptional regulator
MKTAISIPDKLFEAAEQFAQRRGLSRSELYATALQQYLQEHRSEAITEQLNAIYDSESSTLDPAFAHAQTRTVPKDEW